LVVEDNATNQEIVSRFLRREGHLVLQAMDGVAGVKSAQKQIPDLILMDLGLPEMDGWEAIRRIRSNSATAHIPVIALTAHSSLDEVKQAQEAGCDAFEVKPVDYKRLMKKIRAFVRE